jgi:hypothetical protein
LCGILVLLLLVKLHSIHCCLQNLCCCLQLLHLPQNVLAQLC